MGVACGLGAVGEKRKEQIKKLLWQVYIHTGVIETHFEEVEDEESSKPYIGSVQRTNLYVHSDRPTTSTERTNEQPVVVQETENSNQATRPTNPTKHPNTQTPQKQVLHTSSNM